MRAGYCECSPTPARSQVISGSPSTFAVRKRRFAAAQDYREIKQAPSLEIELCLGALSSSGRKAALPDLRRWMGHQNSCDVASAKIYLEIKQAPSPEIELCLEALSSSGREAALPDLRMRLGHQIYVRMWQAQKTYLRM